MADSSYMERFTKEIRERIAAEAKKRRENSSQEILDAQEELVKSGYLAIETLNKTRGQIFGSQSVQPEIKSIVGDPLAKEVEPLESMTELSDAQLIDRINKPKASDLMKRSDIVLDQSIGRQPNAKYMIPQNFDLLSPSSSKLTQDHQNAMYKMWTTDCWEGLINPPKGLNVAHFICALSRNEKYSVVVQKCYVANRNLAISRALSATAELSGCKALGEMIKKRDIPEIQVSDTISDLITEMKGSVEVIKDLVAIFEKRMMAYDASMTVAHNRTLAVAENIVRLSEHMMLQMTTLIERHINLGDKKTGSVMVNSGPSCSYTAPSPASSLYKSELTEQTAPFVDSGHDDYCPPGF